jgi:hypothetical protein
MSVRHSHHERNIPQCRQHRTQRHPAGKLRDNISANSPAWVTLNGQFLIVKLAEAFGLILGSVLAGAVIWYPVRWVDGQSRTPEIKKFTLGFAAICLVLYLANNFYGPR